MDSAHDHREDMKKLPAAILTLFILAACSNDAPKSDNGSRAKDAGLVAIGGSAGLDAGTMVAVDGKPGSGDVGGLAGSSGSADAAAKPETGTLADAGGRPDTGNGGSGGGTATPGTGGQGGKGGREGSGGKSDSGGVPTGGTTGIAGKTATGGSGANPVSGGTTAAGGKTAPGDAGVDSGSSTLPKLAWAGVRSSGYGIADAGFKTFPAPDKWTSAIKTMTGYFTGAQPSATIWLVGEVDFDMKGMILEFPKPEDGKTYSSLYQFAKSDKHEAYLGEFDAQGIQVFLEIEPGDADIPTLIDLVLSRYKKHPSVIGLAIDAEWINKTSETDTETPVTDVQAKSWEALVKSYSPSYRLLLKHFEEGNLPKSYRGDIVFACDDESNGSYASFKNEMKTFADAFYPNDVMFQIGYPSDHDWWSKLTAPIPQTIGKDLEAQTKQRFGILWVDFSVNDPTIGLIP